MGLGLMGHGIGLVSAQAGYEVVAVEAKPEALEAGKKRIDASLKKLLGKVSGSFLTVSHWLAPPQIPSPALPHAPAYFA